MEQAGTRDRQTQPAQPEPGATLPPREHETDHVEFAPVDPGLARMHRSDLPRSLVDLGPGWVLRGRVRVAGLPGLSSDRGLWPVGRGGQVAAAAGGPRAAVNSLSQASAQGQCMGSRRWMRRPERIGRAGTLIS